MVLFLYTSLALLFSVRAFVQKLLIATYCTRLMCNFPYENTRHTNSQIPDTQSSCTVCIRSGGFFLCTFFNLSLLPIVHPTRILQQTNVVVFLSSLLLIAVAAKEQNNSPGRCNPELFMKMMNR